MLVSTLPFLVGLDDLGAARALLLVQLVVCWGATLAVVSTLVGDTIDAHTIAHHGSSLRSSRPVAATWAVVIVFVLIVANPFVVKVFVNGLESGVVALTQSTLLLIIVRRRGRVVQSTTVGQRWALGGLLSLVLLARTDGILLLGCLGLWALAEMWRAETTVSNRVRPLVETFAVPVLIGVLYVMTNVVWFDTPWQISGLVKRQPITAVTALAFLAVAAVAALIARHSFRRLHGAKARRQPKLTATGEVALATGWYGAFCVLITGYYVVLQSQRWLWYFAPVVLYLLVLVVLVAADLALGAIAEAPAGRRASAAVAPVLAILGVPLLIGFGLQLRTFLDPELRSIQEANRDAGVAIDVSLPDDAVLASWDAGVVGYFSHRRVVNLDGVVNSFEFYQAGRDGRIGAFLDDDGVGWIVNHGLPVDGDDQDIIRFVKSTWGPDAAEALTLERTWPFRYSGSTTASGGSLGDGSRDLAVFLYRLPPVEGRSR
jgi:hypothetical protein